MRLAWVAVTAMAGCGRVAFDPVASLDDAPPIDLDVIQSAWNVGQVSCQGTTSTIPLSRDVPAGSTLVVVAVVREPQSTSASIAGGPGTWIVDVETQSVETTNRRALWVYRQALSAPMTAGTPITVTHPSGRASAAGVLAIPVGLTAPGVPPSVAEGSVPPFSGPYSSVATSTLCVVAHPNSNTATFDAPWVPVLDLLAFCGGNRESTGAHVAVQQSGTVDCMGTISNDTLSWLTAVYGYNDLPLP
jgi:hypothetical protein